MPLIIGSNDDEASVLLAFGLPTGAVLDAIVKDNRFAQQIVDGLQAGYESMAS